MADTPIKPSRGAFVRRSMPVLAGSRGVENYLYSTHPQTLFFYGRRMLLYNEMRQDTVIRSILDGLKMPCTGSPFKIVPGGTDTQSKKMAEFMPRALGMSDDTAMNITWGQHIREMLSCIEFGFAMAEKVLYKYDGGEIGYKQLNYLPPLRLDWGRPWEVGKDGEVVGIRQQHSEGSFASREYSQSIDYKRVLHFQYQYRERQPDGESILSAIWRDWKNRVELEEFEQIGVEHATGNTPVIYPPSNVDQEKGDEILEAIEEMRLGDRMGIVMPGSKQGVSQNGEIMPSPGWLLESFNGNMGAVDVRKIIDGIDNRIYARAFMQFMMMSRGTGGGSFALARTSMDFFILHLIEIQQNLTEIWQRYAIRHIYRLNLHKWPRAECPRIYWMPPALADLTTSMNAFLELTNLGVLEPTEADKEHWRTVLQLAQEYEGSEKLTKVEELRNVQLQQGNGSREGSPNRGGGNLAGEPQTNRVAGRRPGNDGK